jgi:hypothetical protein
MNAKSRIDLTMRIKNYFVAEIKKACGKDFPLIENRLQEFLNVDSLRESLFKAKEAVEEIKRKSNSRQESHKATIRRFE